MIKKYNGYINKQEQLMDEQIKILRTNLTFNVDKKENTIYMVTSSKQGEGKTFISKHLAQSLVDLDYKVLIIDTDMRRPKIHKRFGFSNNYGLSNVISNQIAFKDALIHDNETNLDILTSGTIPPNPSELLNSKNFVNILAYIKDIYDYIILDTPPILPVTDALVIGKLVDKTILVINSKSTTKDTAIEAKERLDNLNIPIFGVVLNKVNKSKSNGYY